MPLKMIRRIFVSFFLLVSAILIAFEYQPIQASDTSPEPLSLLPASTSDKTQVLRIVYSNQGEVDSLAHSLDIWEVNQQEGYVVAAVSPEQLHWLDVAGYVYEIDAEKTRFLQAPDAVLDPRFYYYDENFLNPNGLYIVDFLQDTDALYPNLTELIDIGDAWQNNGGSFRDMLVLRITNEDPTYGDILEKPAFFLMAEIHAREVTTPELAIRYIRYLTTGFDGMGGYGLDPDVTWMVNHHVVYVLIMQNPDGHVVNEMNTGSWWRKNVDNDDGCSDPSSWGVDLNRNHSFLWGCCGGSSADPCAEDYRGVAGASEPETFAFQDYIMTVIPDQNGPNDDWTIAPASPITTTGFFISLHSYADDILWPWFLPGYPDAPNQAQMRSIARKMASIDSYYYPAGTIGYTVDGSANYWTYGKLGIPAFTFEVGPGGGSCGGFYPQFGCIDGIDGMSRDFWAENRPVFIYATKVARQPYQNSFGPDTQNVAISPTSVPRGLPAELSAITIDIRYSGDPLTPITSAEYFIDSPGPDGTGVAMAPIDGVWGGFTEGIVATVDTSGLSLGQHYLLVHGMNDNGFWGPFTAVFLDVTAPQAPFADFTSNSPVELGQSMLFTNLTIGLEPITYLWDFGDGVGTSTEINPAYSYLNTGTYTVTLTASNEYGDDTIANTVSVIPPGIDSVVVSQVTQNPIFPGDLVQFSADIIPDNAGKPYDYTIDFDDGIIESGVSSSDPFTFEHFFNSSGGFTIQIQVQNDSMLDPVTGDLEISLAYRIFLPLSTRH